MNVKSATFALVCATVIAVPLTSHLRGQDALPTRNPQRTPQITTSRVPGPLRQNLLVLGDRLMAAGQERLVLQGQLTASRGEALAAQLVYELPDRVRFEITGGDAKTLVFDGIQAQRISSTLTDADRALLETFVYDLPEGFFDALRTDGSLRLLGSRFRADDGTTPNYLGPWFDIYELLLPIRTAAMPQRRQKQFFFDSESALLRQVRYQASDAEGSTLVNVHLSWNSNGSQATPSEIVRVENGATVFTFTVTSSATGPRVDDGVFRAAQ